VSNFYAKNDVLRRPSWGRARNSAVYGQRTAIDLAAFAIDTRRYRPAPGSSKRYFWESGQGPSHATTYSTHHDSSGEETTGGFRARSMGEQGGFSKGGQEHLDHVCHQPSCPDELFQETRSWAERADRTHHLTSTARPRRPLRRVGRAEVFLRRDASGRYDRSEA